MPFRSKSKFPEFADLKGILAQSRDTENSLYQTVAVLIDRLQQLKLQADEEIKKKVDDTDATKRFATKFATFLTQNDETAVLPNSMQLVAGTNITFNTTVPNKLTINATGGAGADHVPMSTGAEPLEIMSDGAGQVFLTEYVP